MEWHCTIGALSTRDVDDSSSSSCSPYAVCSLSSSEIGRFCFFLFVSGFWFLVAMGLYLCSCFICTLWNLRFLFLPTHSSFFSTHSCFSCMFAHYPLSSRHVSYYCYYCWVSSPHARSAGLDRADRQLRGRAQSKGAGTRTRNHVVRKTSARSRPGATPRMPHT